MESKYLNEISPSLFIAISRTIIGRRKVPWCVFDMEHRSIWGEQRAPRHNHRKAGVTWLWIMDHGPTTRPKSITVSYGIVALFPPKTKWTGVMEIPRENRYRTTNLVLARCFIPSNIGTNLVAQVLSWLFFAPPTEKLTTKSGPELPLYVSGQIQIAWLFIYILGTTCAQSTREYREVFHQQTSNSRTVGGGKLPQCVARACTTSNFPLGCQSPLLVVVNDTPCKSY